MDQATYRHMAECMSRMKPDEKTPENQKFHIGEIVKITNPKKWFSKESFDIDKHRLFQIEHSYKQKYGGNNIASYHLKHLFENNESAWYDENELSLVKSISEINEENDKAEYIRLKKIYE